MSLWLSSQNHINKNNSKSRTRTGLVCLLALLVLLVTTLKSPKSPASNYNDNGTGAAAAIVSRSQRSLVSESLQDGTALQAAYRQDLADYLAKQNQNVDSTVHYTIRNLNDDLVNMTAWQARRCFDDDYRPPRPRATHCGCTDPGHASKRLAAHPDRAARGVVYPRWMDYHKRLVKVAKHIENNDVQQLDVLFLGDSIAERRLGTQGLAKSKLPQYKQINAKFFDKQLYPNTARLQGAVLGAEGDTSYELWWHLLHGWLQPPVQPRAIVLHIGMMGDLIRVGCSRRNTLAGILNVAHFLHEQRPEALILVHSLLPREGSHQTGGVTGWEYQDALWLHAELKRYCEYKPEKWHFLDMTELFLEHPLTDPPVVNRTLIKNGIPGMKGFRLWNGRLVTEIARLLESHTQDEMFADILHNEEKEQEKMEGKETEQGEAGETAEGEG